MARPTFLSTAWAYSLKIGGRDLHDFGVISLGTPQLNMAPVDVPFDVIPSRHIAIASTGAFRPSPFVLSGQIAGGSVAELRANLELFKAASMSMRGSNYDVITPLRLESADYTDRYFPVVYTGGFTAQVVGQNPTGGEIATFSLPLLRLTPFAIATTPTNATPGATGPSFEVLAAGTAPSWPRIEIEGASTTPSFYFTDMSFFADMDYDLAYTKIDGSVGAGSSGATTPIDQFEPGDIAGGRYIQAATFTTSFASVIQNPTEGSVLLWINPAFGITGVDTVIWQFYIDANNSIYLWWDDSDDDWVFTKAIGGVPVSLNTSAASAHASGDSIAIAFSYGPDGMKIYVNSAAPTTNATVTGVTGTSGTVYLGDAGATLRPACKYNQMAMLPFQLDDDTMRRYMSSPEFVAPYIVNKARTASLIANERAIVDIEKGTIIHVDTALAQTNDLGNWDTNGWPIIRPPKTCFYLPSPEAASSIKINYRKRYL